MAIRRAIWSRWAIAAALSISSLARSDPSCSRCNFSCCSSSFSRRLFIRWSFAARLISPFDAAFRTSQIFSVAVSVYKNRKTQIEKILNSNFIEWIQIMSSIFRYSKSIFTKQSLNNELKAKSRLVRQHFFQFFLYLLWSFYFILQSRRVLFRLFRFLLQQFKRKIASVNIVFLTLKGLPSRSPPLRASPPSCSSRVCPVRSKYSQSDSSLLFGLSLRLESEKTKQAQ